MVFERFLKKDETEELEEYTELPMETEAETGKEALKIIVDKLEGYSSVDKIMRHVRNGNIVIVKIKELKDTNMDELKHAVGKLRNACIGIDGDVAGVGDEWIVVTPSTVRIQR